VPYPPGGGTDIVARVIGAELTQSLGQTVVIDNRPGGNSIIGTGALAQAAPDGYTMALLTDAFAANIALGRTLPYNSEKDFVPIIELQQVPFVLIVNQNVVPMRTLPELVAHAKANAGWLTLASLGPGSPHETAAAWFRHMAGIDMLIVPYRGGNPALQDLIAGHVKSMLYGISAAEASIKAGQVRALAVTAAKRVKNAPDIPTFAEQGYPDFKFASSFGVMMPRGTPPDIVQKMNAAINKALTTAEVRAKIVATGGEIVGGTPAQFQASIGTYVAMYRKIFEIPGARPN
jgi:tripartite-type tricarboxylate transporter receptor subunit TctC